MDQFEKIMEGKFNSDLAGSMEMSDLCDALKNITVQHVYSHIEIANREQTARNVIAGLLSAIMEELRDRPTGPLALYTYRSAPLHSGEPKGHTNYDLAQRATDYVAGMTDGHALAQFQRIAGMRSSF